MPEPTSTTVAAVATYTAAGLAVPMITAFGVPLGLRADVLIAGFLGSLSAIVLLNSVPSQGDSWQLLLRTTLTRMCVAMASSVVAGYCTPMALLLANMPEPLFLGAAFAVGGGAQRIFLAIISKYAPAQTSGGSQQ